MVPMFLDWQTLLVILVIVVVLFGGAKIAGIGKASGQAIREFRDELKPTGDAAAPAATPAASDAATAAQPADAGKADAS